MTNEKSVNTKILDRDSVEKFLGQAAAFLQNHGASTDQLLGILSHDTELRAQRGQLLAAAKALVGEYIAEGDDCMAGPDNHCALSDDGRVCAICQARAAIKLCEATDE